MNRSVATDALATLGSIIGDNEKRDAIHLAVVPVVAAVAMLPGQHVDMRDGHAVPVITGEGVGIVDPFLIEPVKQGQTFWLVIYPRQITSLRHVWSHPAFPDEQGVEPKKYSKEYSEEWLRDFCSRSDCPDYEKVLAVITGTYRSKSSYYDCYINNDCLHFGGEDAHGDIPPEFWDHVEVVTGKKMTKRPEYFSCSC